MRCLVIVMFLAISQLQAGINVQRSIGGAPFEPVSVPPIVPSTNNVTIDGAVDGIYRIFADDAFTESIGTVQVNGGNAITLLIGIGSDITPTASLIPGCNAFGGIQASSAAIRVQIATTGDVVGLDPSSPGVSGLLVTSPSSVEIARGQVTFDDLNELLDRWGDQCGFEMGGQQAMMANQVPSLRMQTCPAVTDLGFECHESFYSYFESCSEADKSSLLTALRALSDVYLSQRW